MTLVTHSAAETEEAGFHFGKTLTPPCVVALNGDLGAGKTCFVRGAARAFDIPESVVSPTFSLVNVYSGKHMVVHMDAYRLNSPAEMVQIGFEDYLAQNSVCFIEWAERIEMLLPKSVRRVSFRVTGDATREIEIRG